MTLFQEVYVQKQAKYKDRFIHADPEHTLHPGTQRASGKATVTPLEGHNTPGTLEGHNTPEDVTRSPTGAHPAAGRQ